MQCRLGQRLDVLLPHLQGLGVEGLEDLLDVGKEDLKGTGGLGRGDLLYTLYRAVAGDVTTVKHCNTFRALNIIFRALSTSVWQKSGRFYSDL